MNVAPAINISEAILIPAGSSKQSQVGFSGLFDMLLQSLLNGNTLSCSTQAQECALELSPAPDTGGKRKKEGNQEQLTEAVLSTTATPGNAWAQEVLLVNQEEQGIKRHSDAVTTAAEASLYASSIQKQSTSAAADASFQMSGVAPEMSATVTALGSTDSKGTAIPEPPSSERSLPAETQVTAPTVVKVSSSKPEQNVLPAKQNARIPASQQEVARETSAAIPDVTDTTFSEFLSTTTTTDGTPNYQPLTVPQVAAEPIPTSPVQAEEAVAAAATLFQDVESDEPVVQPKAPVMEAEGGTEEATTTDLFPPLELSPREATRTNPGIPAEVAREETQVLQINRSFGHELGEFLINRLQVKTVDGSHSAEIRLHPEHLGRLQVNLEVTQGQVSLHLTTENQAAQQVIQQRISELTASLTAAGMTLTGVEVSVSDQRQSHRDQPEHELRSQNRGKGQEPVAMSVSSFSHLSIVDLSA